MFNQGLTHSQKVLVLVLVPLLLVLSLMAVHYMLLQESEREAQRAEHARIMAMHINRFHQLMMSAAAGVSGTAISEELLGKNATNRMERSFWKELELMEEHALPNSEESELVEQMRQCVASGVDDLSKIKETMSEGDFADKVSQMRKIRRLVREVSTKSEKLLKYEQKILESSPKIQQEKRNQIQNLLIIGAILNVLIVAILTHLFNQSTTQRLEVLQENTKKLAAKKALQEPLSGTDEIAQVDRAFHEMVDELTRVERMKQEFVAMVSHDLRTPLTSVKGVLDLLEQGVVDPKNETGQKRLQFANQSVDQLIKLITDLLDIERLESGSFTMDFAKGDLRDVIESAAQSVYTFADQSGVVIKCETKSIELPIDSDRIGQVVINLLSNAIKFSPKDSIVTVNCSQQDGFALVKVIDSGRGIAPEFRETIFERFKQVDKSDAKRLSGSGLGLAICKSLIEAHHGEIGVDSEVGAGSTFWFKIPLVQKSS